MRKILTLFLCLAAFVAAYSQPRGNGQRGGGISGRLYGKVVDAGNKGISAASVTLVTNRMDSITKQPKEVVIGGMLTNSSGDFNIESIPVMGKYTLRVSGIGYKVHEQPFQFAMPNRNGGTPDQSAMMSALDKDLGNIKLEIDNQVLGNVTVSASRPALTMGIDRKVFSVDKNLVSQGGTAVDVMKNVPSVNVDLDGNITMRNAAPQIFVDGRPTNLTLEQIPADAIESVEIITNPSAKFDASGGTSGILNIVLKKNKRVGYSGNLRANIDSRGRVGGGGDINVRQDKLNFFANAMINQRRSIGTGVTERRDLGFNPSNSRQNDRSVMNGLFGFGRFGLDYFIDNRNTITLSQSFARGRMKPNTKSYITTDTESDNIMDLYQERFTKSVNDFRNASSQVSFKHNFPKAGREWTADVTYNKSRNENDNLIDNNYYNLPGSFIRSYNQQQVGSGKNENLIFQTDYVSPINDHSKFEMGARTSIRTVDNLTDYFIINPDNSKIPITAQNVNFSSRDQVYAAYANYSNRVKNFGYQVGLRAESSNYEGNLKSKGQSFEIDFPISLFPSVFLSQKLSENDDLQLNYSRRINRPNFWQLFPFTDISDTLNISRGNPGLKPEFTNSIELSYSKIFKKNRDNFLASVYFKNTTDLITRIQQREFVPAYNDSLLVLSYVNANQSYVTGLELTSKTKMSKWWDLTANANIFTAKIDLKDQPDPDQFPSYFLKLNNIFKLSNSLSLQLSGDYQSKIISSPGGTGGGGRGGGFGGGGMFGGPSTAAQGYIRPNYSIDAGLRFEFLKEKKASLSLNINDIFRTRKYDSHTESAFFIQDSWRRRDPQVARLNFNWRFGKFDPNLFKRKSTKGEGNINMDSGF